MTRGGRYGQGPPEFGLVVSWQPVTRGVVLEPVGRLAGWEDAAATLTDLYERRIRGNAVLTIP